eukprot:7808623-Pyramimonas_sp.AAC.1
MFPDYYAQTTGIPRVGGQPDNPCARATASDFYRSELTRGAGYEAGIFGRVPHRGCLAAPVDQEVNPR